MGYATRKIRVATSSTPVDFPLFDSIRGGKGSTLSLNTQMADHIPFLLSYSEECFPTDSVNASIRSERKLNDFRHRSDGQCSPLPTLSPEHGQSTAERSNVQRGVLQMHIRY